MQVRISDPDGVPIYVQLVRQIKYLMSSGRLKAGEQTARPCAAGGTIAGSPQHGWPGYREPGE